MAPYEKFVKKVIEWFKDHPEEGIKFYTTLIQTICDTLSDASEWLSHIEVLLKKNLFRILKMSELIKDDLYVIGTVFLREMKEAGKGDHCSEQFPTLTSFITAYNPIFERRVEMCKALSREMDRKRNEALLETYRNQG